MSDKHQPQFKIFEWHAWIVLLVFCLEARPTSAQMDMNQEPIRYELTPPNDRIAELEQWLAAGYVDPTWDDRHGWLRSVLDLLEVPTSSQTLVFSKTSLQLSNISPDKPRAIYFNDDVYVGWVQGGDVLELSAVDPVLGAIFYTVDQRDRDQMVIRRDDGRCLGCHVSPRTKRIPGYLVRSVYPDRDGQPDFRRGTVTTDHRTPFPVRFGGWYVTGSLGLARHQGNRTFPRTDGDHADNSVEGLIRNVASSIRTDEYLTGDSDIVALMVLEHQTQMHNAITKASYVTRQAIHQQRMMNRILGRSEDFVSDTTLRRIEDAAEEVLRELLFCGEYRLSSKIEGTSEFSNRFPLLGPTDRYGRSLREFDLQQRLFRYPCSFLIYSKAFNALPEIILDRVDQRLVDVLQGRDQSADFKHLSTPIRRDIREILADTLPRLRDRLREAS